jgi:predicted P-loop ATPase
MKYLVGAVARAFQPGCKMDTMIILEGPQGLRKSSALRTMCDAIGPDLFTDEISDPNSKDAGLQMQGAFMVEIAELDAFRRAEITQIKAWLSRQTDRFRRPYGKIVEEFPRSCVFAGTVNPSGTGYLKDPTGARRFEPVKCGNIRLEELAAAAPQIWAEAVALYDTGIAWWLEGDENGLAELVQRDRYEEDPYGQMIDDLITNYTRVTTIQIMGLLEIPKERRNSGTNRRIASHLHSKGWQREVTEKGVFYNNPTGLNLTDIPE